MEILIGLVVVVAIIWLLGATIGQQSLDKPIETWSDEELVRRLPKYQNLLSAQMKAQEWDKIGVTSAKMKEIEAEITKRQQAYKESQAAPKKLEVSPSNTSSPDDYVLRKTEEMLFAFREHGIDIKALARQLLDQVKSEVAPNGAQNFYAESFGDKVVENQAMMVPRLAAGLTVEDVRGYWNLPPILKLVAAKVQEFVDFTAMNVAEQQGQDLISVARERRKRHARYGDPTKWNPHLPVNAVFSSDDADIYPEFQLRVGRWEEKQTTSSLQETPKSYTSYNAMLRAMIRSGKI